jgi:hypothetical protein
MYHSTLAVSCPLHGTKKDARTCTSVYPGDAVTTASYLNNAKDAASVNISNKDDDDVSAVAVQQLGFAHLDDSDRICARSLLPLQQLGRAIKQHFAHNCVNSHFVKTSICQYR